MIFESYVENFVEICKKFRQDEFKTDLFDKIY